MMYRIWLQKQAQDENVPYLLDGKFTVIPRRGSWCFRLNLGEDDRYVLFSPAEVLYLPRLGGLLCLNPSFSFGCCN